MDVGEDYFRRSSSARSLPGYREWQHFVIVGGGVDALVNFSVTCDAGTPVGRVLVVVRADGQVWEGALQRIPGDGLDVRAGKLGARFGDSWIAYENGAYEIHARVRRGPAVDLRIEPRCEPFVAHNLEAGDGGLRSWLVLPRLVADGEIRIGSRVISLRGAMGYHDHNWGAWSGEVVWQWGFGLPERDEASPWTVVFGRLIDERRACVLMQSLFLWEGHALRRMFRDRQIDVIAEGGLRGDCLLKIPHVMRLVDPGDLAAVPRRLVIGARAGGDRIEARFDAESAAQVLLPRARDLRTTEIDETAGSLVVTGTVHGRPVELRGRGIFEFVHARF
ncbi:hypothetical protein WMF45_50910 [Sorangium sp. So ce448]|uniref:hypothetical protein n=1 Tax=Sorangium sp. So ce448 TaxID=3133314 RepID=UPI003F619D40